jgi:hypothetical protein
LAQTEGNEHDSEETTQPSTDCGFIFKEFVTEFEGIFGVFGGTKTKQRGK